MNVLGRRKIICSAFDHMERIAQSLRKVVVPAIRPAITPGPETAPLDGQPFQKNFSGEGLSSEGLYQKTPIKTGRLSALPVPLFSWGDSANRCPRLG